MMFFRNRIPLLKVITGKRSAMMSVSDSYVFHYYLQYIFIINISNQSLTNLSYDFVLPDVSIYNIANIQLNYMPDNYTEKILISYPRSIKDTPNNIIVGCNEWKEKKIFPINKDVAQYSIGEYERPYIEEIKDKKGISKER